MSVRDVIAAAIWLYEREIAGAPLPHPSWETFKENDPETAMVYETHAASVDAALRAAGYVVEREQAIAALVEALTECADDLEAEIAERYRATRHHPSERRREERDMAPVLAARAALALYRGDVA